MNGPFIMTIFGATGDLARNKLIPALFFLFQKGALGKDFSIIGFARRPFTDMEFTEMLSESIHSNDTYHHSDWERFRKHIFYQQGQFDADEGYDILIKRLHGFDKQTRSCALRLFYLATPPDNYQTIIQKMVAKKLSKGCGHKESEGKWEHQKPRFIIEKPFGKDLETAKELDKMISEIFDESQIFRVDHYLGKETVQNMIAFRFANSVFEPVWNNQFIDHVQITWGEKKGIGTRGKFFDGVGLLRDVAQNHLLQLVAAVAMEQPKSFSKEGVRDARASAIKSIQMIAQDDVARQVVRGQYEGYTNEKSVDPNSQTETAVGLKLFVDSKRFAGVPFYLRAVKQAPADLVKISVVFTQTCHLLFKEYGCPEIGNVLTFHIQPDEGIGMRVIAKQPGAKVSLGTVDMKFSYKEEFGWKGAEAYEKVLQDIFAGDQMLFNRSDELESSWEFITNILNGWRDKNAKVYSYKAGSWGSQEADGLVEKDGRKWL